MRHVVISATTRPHVVSAAVECYCKPTIDGDITIHHQLDVKPALQPYMCCFSEQYARGMAPK
jgi:hypothetical protein